MIREAKCRWVKKGYGFYNTKKLGQLPAEAPTKSSLSCFLQHAEKFTVSPENTYCLSKYS
ncbi:DUF3173 family protein [Gracilibacillus dipsosauri]|uniref:Uncharacterized protein n=1 Tax=Gracilibacillus dipsosauri TaxID=178340 RepID=A0A317KTX2_9BACI|nr:DUF3173 family protein [Gracilibacillus dipsosauri]PWU66756.1 hypothetical protein DLJ74_19850 [Gracilibacillus dipsosauri]